MKLEGLNVVSFESRLSKTMMDLIRLNGGNPIEAPSMREVPLENNEEAFKFAEKFFRNEIDVLILLTGVGTKTLIQVLETRFPNEKILDQFRKTKIVPRGPKPIRVLNELKIPFSFAVAEPNTWKELLDTLDQNEIEVPIKGKVVAVQEYGVTNPELVEGLETRGAEVLRVPVYRWALPEDTTPLEKAIQRIVAGEADVAIFTTAVQVDHLFQVARNLSLEKKLKTAFENLVIASVGPDTSQGLKNFGLTADLEPESPKMGPLVTLTAEKAKIVLQRKRSSDCTSQVRETALQFLEQNELNESIFLKACRSEKTNRTPIWIMRQAGRYMKEYKEIRDKNSFLKICKNKDLVTEITVMAQEKLKVDAAIIFSDILLLVEPMGLGLDYIKGDGPSISKSIQNAKDVDNIPAVDVRHSMRFVLDAIRQTRSALASNIPLLGFAGAPFTMASYMIEGGSSKDFSKTRKMMQDDPGVWKALVDKIARATGEYLNAQITAGAQAVQLFDSWAGLLTPAEYEKFAYPYSKKVFDALRPGTISIHFGTKTAPFLKKFSEVGASVIGVDQKVSIKEAWKTIGYKKAIQGNLDPEVLLKDKTVIRSHVHKILEEAEGRPGHIFNLGHGILPDTPVENAIYLVELIRELSSQ